MSEPASADGLKMALAWLGIGVGLSQIVRPEPYNEILGHEGHDTLMRAHGLRGVTLGVGALLARDPAPWIWGRVLGDVMDVATIAASYRRPRAHRNTLLTGLALLAGVTVLDVICAQSLRTDERRPPPPRRNYLQRTGFPRGPVLSRGLAKDFEVPKDLRIPKALRPWTGNKPVNSDKAKLSTLGAANSIG